MKLADFQEGWSLPLEHWSASSLNMFARCPRQWQCRYLHNRREAPGAARVLGRANHSASEFNLAAKILSGEDKPVEEVVEYFNDKAWPNAVNDAGGTSEVQWDDSDEAQRALGAKMVEAYRVNVSPRVEPVEVEARISLTIADVPIPVIGFVDVVQIPGRPIIDLKTSKARRSTVKPDWRLQGRIYQLAYPGAVDWHVVTKAKMPTTITGLDEPGLLQAEENAAETRNMIRQLSALANHYFLIYGPDEDWPQMGVLHDWACNWCAYRSDCPSWSKAAA